MRSWWKILWYSSCWGRDEPPNNREQIDRLLLSAVGSRKGEVWYLLVRSPEHNHDGSNPVAHPTHRKLTTKVQDSIQALSKSDVEPRAIASTLRQQDEDLTIRIGDIYNARKRIQNPNSSAVIPVRKRGLTIYMRYRLNEENQVTHLFFAHQYKSIRFWNQTPFLEMSLFRQCRNQYA